MLYIVSKTTTSLNVLYVLLFI